MMCFIHMWVGDQLRKAFMGEDLRKKTVKNQGMCVRMCAPTVALHTCICAFYMFIPRAADCEVLLLKHTVSVELPN